MVTPAEELAELKLKLAARKGKGGYAQNVADIEKRIAEMEANSG